MQDSLTVSSGGIDISSVANQSLNDPTVASLSSKVKRRQVVSKVLYIYVTCVLQGEREGREESRGVGREGREKRESRGEGREGREESRGREGREGRKGRVEGRGGRKGRAEGRGGKGERRAGGGEGGKGERGEQRGGEGRKGERGEQGEGREGREKGESRGEDCERGWKRRRFLVWLWQVQLIK